MAVTQGALPANAESLYRLGWTLENDGSDASMAIEAYRSAAAIGVPALAVDALFRAGFVAQREKMRFAAIDAYRECLAIAGENEVRSAAAIHATFWLGFHLEAEGHYLDAIRCYREVRYEGGLLALEASYHGLLCLAAIGRFSDALDWSGDYPARALEVVEKGHDPQALIEAIERERAELALVLRMEGGA